MAAVAARSVACLRAPVSTSRQLKQSPAFTKAVSRTSACVARKAFTVVAADRAMWLPGAEPPSYLDGTLPGDYGFDPLGLGSDPDRLKWYAEAELNNGRWAMLAVFGILGRELLGVEGKWFEAGAMDYDLSFLSLLAIQFPVMGMIETKRYEGFKATGATGFMNMYPFDPLGMASPDMAVKEVKNGRLAMLAFAGFLVQALVTRDTPIANWQAHIANPTLDTTIVSSVGNLINVV